MSYDLSFKYQDKSIPASFIAFTIHSGTFPFVSFVSSEK